MTAVLVFLTVAKDLSAQVAGQRFEVVPETANPTVGDSVTIRFRVRLDERDLLFDTIPQIVGVLPPGVRILSVEKLSRTPDRIFHGRAVLAFYRPGKQPIPIFGLPFMRAVKGVQRATLASDSAFVDITPLLPPGNPALKDIRELERRPFSLLPAIAVALLLLAAVPSYYLIRRRRRRPPLILPPEPAADPVAPTPYQIALDRLDSVERERWPSRGRVAAHYEAVAQTLRQYLEAAENVSACERTTSELLWALPPYLSRAGLRDRCHDVLSEADLVKFARVRPGEAGAADFLRRARHLLQAWHEARPAEESVDAIR
ncbi:MAG TPA: hypothetical protein VNO19_06320 [Gemmatimonadales bacterium]|nr:hypothetical protein [Gemmatimonadales bacterium]